jgi:hypothetical protein
LPATESNDKSSTISNSTPGNDLPATESNDNRSTLLSPISVNDLQAIGMQEFIELNLDEDALQINHEPEANTSRQELIDKDNIIAKLQSENSSLKKNLKKLKR